MEDDNKTKKKWKKKMIEKKARWKRRKQGETKFNLVYK
jgi:hypothetical protein